MILFVAAFLLALMLRPNVVGLTYVGASPLSNKWDGTSALVNILSQNFSMKTMVVLNWMHVTFPKSKGMIFLVSPTKALSKQEIQGISELVREGYVLVVADEGVYSNAVLKALNVPIRVEGKELLVNGSPSFTVTIDMGGKNVSVEYAYASPLKVWGKAKVIATAGHAPVAAIYEGAVTVYVFGDGTIFTNAALTPPSSLNPYVRLLMLLKASVRGASVAIIDAEPYVLKPESISELLSSGQPAPKIVAAIINPYRYYYALLTSYEEAPLVTTFVIGVATFVLLAYVINAALRTLRNFGEISVPGLTRKLKLSETGSAWFSLMKKACLEGVVTHTSLRGVCENVIDGEENKARKLMIEALSDKQAREEVLRIILLFSSG